MAPRIFVDTSGWYALVDRSDTYHGQAASTVKEVVERGSRLVTTDYVLDESCTLAKARAGSIAAKQLLDLVRKTQLLEWEWIGSERFDRAEQMFRKHADHGYSFTDCSSFVVMRELAIKGVITTDRHFEEAGFTPLLKRQ